MSDCERCGLDIWSECQCHVHELEKRVTKLEEELDKLTKVVFKMNGTIKAMMENLT